MLKGRPTIDGRPGESLEPLDFDKLKKKLQDEYGRICFLTLLLVIFQSPRDWRTRNAEQYFLLRCGVVIWNLPIFIWGVISLRLSFPLLKVMRLILSFLEEAAVKIKPKIPNFILWKLKYKLYQLKVLAKRSRLNGHTAGFPPQTQKLTPSLGLGGKGSSGQVAC